MPEVKTNLFKTSDEDGDNVSYMILDHHTLKDVLRHVLKECGDADEFLYLCGQVVYEL